MIYAIADDLTGALEVGAKFAARGFSASVAYDESLHADETSVFVIDTETRHLPASEAAAKIAAICHNRPAPTILYKKTDSTLRGNIAAELGALQASFPEREIFYVPAYPAMGRTVRIGELLVDGIPLHRTAFANDPLSPITSSSVKSALGNVQAIIFDGETEADVLAAAKHIASQSKPVIVSGPAAIAAALAEVLPFQKSTQAPLPALKRCLVINGSLHPASHEQMHAATFDHEWKRFEYTGQQAGAERALRLGESVQRYIQQNTVDALLVFGGDTAYGIHRALGAQPFTSCGEALPGVPVSQAAGLYWITKAGGFGAANLIEELRRKLSS